MASLVFFPAHNDRGQELLDSYVRPACRDHRVRLRVADRGAHRGTALKAQVFADLVLWDCSVEPAGHVYGALDTWSKVRENNLLVSRTPLPRNVLARHQCAPIHGATFSNAVLGEWLDRWLANRFGDPVSDAPTADLARHYWMYDRPADYFLSFRGTHEESAADWAAAYARTHGVTVRMVPAGEYSYPTECVTQQQMWEGVARLRLEMTATRRVIVHWSATGYLDSFWTSSELLLALWMHNHLDRSGRAMLDEALFVADGKAPAPLRDIALPRPTDPELDRLVELLNNADPYTSAPETQIAPRGLGRLTRLFVRRFGWYKPEFTTPSFWHTVRVPCPGCRPADRQPGAISWSRHLALPGDAPATDYFGYFPAEPASLEGGTLTCPGCGHRLRLVNRRGVRTLWVPVLTTEKDQDRPVIQEHKVWEVVPAD
ncbi:hypothetical protein [Phytohabitans rumicis]|uniref:Uncharacterized protein n=1 Tax=Phytohabitans rumicis TaxID=1076125 RepID=A0A6V8LIY4_9ACTN|nr:hypothetical protein [Phytohabitans rumicis]GFJ94808.1 hypothetical protein Prum_084500 [Phytohabitans rumicis]